MTQPSMPNTTGTEHWKAGTDPVWAESWDVINGRLYIDGRAFPWGILDRITTTRSSWNEEITITIPVYQS